MFFLFKTSKLFLCVIILGDGAYIHVYMLERSFTSHVWWVLIWGRDLDLEGNLHRSI